MVGHFLQGFSTTRKILEKQAPLSQGGVHFKDKKISATPLSPCLPKASPARLLPLQPLPLLQVLGLVARFGATTFGGCLFSSRQCWVLGAARWLAEQWMKESVDVSWEKLLWKF